MNHIQESQNTLFPKVVKSPKIYSSEKEKTINFFVTSKRKSWRKLHLIAEEKVSFSCATNVGSFELYKRCSYLISSFQIENLCPHQGTSVHVAFLPCSGYASFLVDLYLPDVTFVPLNCHSSSM